VDELELRVQSVKNYIELWASRNYTRDPEHRAPLRVKPLISECLRDPVIFVIPTRQVDREQSLDREFVRDKDMHGFVMLWKTRAIPMHQHFKYCGRVRFRGVNNALSY